MSSLLTTKRESQAPPAGGEETASPQTGNENASTRVSESRLENYATICIFLATIFLFGALTWAVKPPRKMMMENRYATKLPSLVASWESCTSFPRRMESYFNDRFLLRSKIISARNVLCFAGLHLSGTPDVLVGPDGWLEYRGDSNLASFLNRNPFTDVEVARVGNEIEARRIWLERHGIRFLFLIAPDKATVYHSMPSYLKPTAGPTRTDQLLAYLHAHTDVETIDLRNVLRTAISKSPGRLLYRKTDSHWNDFGAYTAYTAISNKLRTWFPAMHTLGSVQIATHDDCGDLCRIAGLEQWLHEDCPSVVSDGEVKHWAECKGYTPVHNAMQEELRRVTLTEVDDSALPRAVILHDSFMLNLQPFMSNDFRRSLNLWCYGFPTETILSEKPDIVIEEQVERQLINCMPHPTAEFTQINYHWAHSEPNFE